MRSATIIRGPEATVTDDSPGPSHVRVDAGTWLRREARQLRRPVVRAAAATLLQTLALVGQMWLLAGILEAALLRHAPLATLWRAWLGVLLLAPVRWSLGLWARRETFDAGMHLTVRLRSRLLRRIQALGPLGLRPLASGALITHLVDGADAVLPYFARYLPQATAAVIIPVALVAFIAPVDWISALVLVLTVPLIPVFMVLVGGAAERASRERLAQLARLGAAFMDALGGLVTLRQLGAAERIATELERDGEQYRKLTLQVLRIAFLSAAVLEFFAAVSIAVVAVLIGFRLLWHELAFRHGLFILLLAPEFYLPLRALGALRHARMDAVAAAEQMAALESLTGVAPAPGGTFLPPHAAPAIRIETVGFRHSERGPALQDCTLEIASCAVTAVVGASGAGKSTLLDLLLGFALPDHGRIVVDGIDLATLDATGWRERLAWVPQRPHVFEGSVRDNLLLACPDAGETALRRAAQASGLDVVLARLPRGWQTRLGDHGLGISGGELQRLALARALLREAASVLLLDEPTAHLDAASAATIDAVIRSQARTRTVLVVAHRLEAARTADHVVVLDAGRVVEQGAPGDLQARPGPFAALLRAEAA